MERVRVVVSTAVGSWRPAAMGALLCAALLAAVFAGSHFFGRSTATPEAAAVERIETATRSDSGTLGPWQQSGHAASTPAALRLVAADARGVLLVGDSTGARSRPALAKALGPRPFSWDLWNGRPTHGCVDAVVAMAPTKQLPRTVLVMSGSNDVFEPEAFGPQIERLMSHVGSSRQVYWVAPDVARSAFLEADRDNSRRMRAALDAAATAHANLHVIAWPAALAAMSSQQRATMMVDGVHPSPAGSTELARLIARSIG